MALLLFAIVFPLINFRFHTQLPVAHFVSKNKATLGEAAEKQSEPIEQESVLSKKQRKKNALKTDKTDKLASTESSTADKIISTEETKKKEVTNIAEAANQHSKRTEHLQKPGMAKPKKIIIPTVVRRRIPDAHKDVPTIRIDTLLLDGTEKQRPLTVAKIALEARKAGKTAVDVGEGQTQAIPKTVKIAPLTQEDPGSSKGRNPKTRTEDNLCKRSS